MRLVDELFAMYRNKITDDEEDLDMITFAVLEHYDRNELMEIVKDMDQHELQYFIRLYLLETLKGKFAQLDGTQYTNSRHLH
ncbi:DUF1836 domain-containing protein [Bacillus sp. FJAT-49711]|uniref:DUF6154 family protein n=1 Tax=Bacillus sp. FJAT-49711 TaxID=2833585 RepID=UPI001BC9D5A8|nr:DUF6154 family protein [Bacillus sp. FJAT-49711]MBS4216724.1 DUF1836 domain-containing protein [Bacillus sp. FJAT-49711]